MREDNRLTLQVVEGHILSAHLDQGRRVDDIAVRLEWLRSDDSRVELCVETANRKL